MTQRTIMRLYDGYDTVVQIVHRLELAGVPDRDISVITSNVDSRYPVLAEAAQGAASPVRTGALTGAIIGGCFGVLLGIEALDVPSLDLIAQSGWFPALLAGAAAGALAGMLLGLVARPFLRRDPAPAYARGISQGNTLLTVRVEEEMVPRIEALMGIEQGQAAAGRPATARVRPAGLPEREEPAGYGMGGWSRFEPAASVTPADLDAERRRIDAANQRIQNE